MGRSPSFCLHPSKLLKFNRIYEFAPHSGRKIARQLDRSVADPDEPAHARADGFEHAAHLAVASFPERHAIPAVRAGAGARIDGLDPLESCLAILKLHAAPELFKVDRSVHTDLIFALDPIARMHQAIGQLPVVREKKQPRAVEIQAPDGDPAAGRQAGEDRRTPLRVAARDELALGLVVEEDAPRLRSRKLDRTAVDRNGLAGGAIA